MTELHPWWQGFGHEVKELRPAAPEMARDFLASLQARNEPGVALVATREDDAGATAVHLEIEVERPQDLAYPIKAVEPIAVVFGTASDRPAVLSLREDFPDTLHQNWSPAEAPCSLCVDDRPWQEARLTYSARELLSRIRLWLAKAARGELEDAAQPLDPFFFRSSLSIIAPPSVFARPDGAQLAAFQHPTNPAMIVAEPAANSTGNFSVIAFAVPAQAMTRRMQSPPTTIAALADVMAEMGLDLIAYLRDRLREWAGTSTQKAHRFGTRLAILIDFPMTSAGGQTVHDPRAFITVSSIGKIGEALGVLIGASKAADDDTGFVPAIPPDFTLRGASEQIVPAEVYLTFTRSMATAIAGRQVEDLRRAVLVGAGSLGSQMAINLAREGRFIWTIVDNDYLLPHNLARHGLLAPALGAPKAPALAFELSNLLGEPFDGIVADVLAQPVDPRIEAGLKGAQVIIDTSASVAVSRHLSDLLGISARRVSAFFNPTGTAVVVLSEPSDRSVTLRDLEAQYHALLQSEPALQGHLAVVEKGVRYSGSCRALTNRIPASRAATLSAIAAQGVTQALDQEGGSIGVWTLAGGGAVTPVRQEPFPLHRANADEWLVTYDDHLIQELTRMRTARLPAETGGVLLGIADMSARTMHICHALPQPVDSLGSVSGFERGVAGLAESINAVVASSLYQLRYVGEWHSHPKHYSANPSVIDLSQLAWLTRELDEEGLPALMCIVADDGQLNLVVGQVQDED